MEEELKLKEDYAVLKSVVVDRAIENRKLEVRVKQLEAEKKRLDLQNDRKLVERVKELEAEKERLERALAAAKREVSSSAASILLLHADSLSLSSHDAPQD